MPSNVCFYLPPATAQDIDDGLRDNAWDGGAANMVNRDSRFAERLSDASSLDVERMLPAWIVRNDSHWP